MYIISMMTRLAMILLSILLFVAALLTAGFLNERSIRTNERARLAPPGRLVDLGGRKIHMLCKGNAEGPTVVIEPGAAEPAMLWWTVQDQIASFARVCTYDRAGYQWSDPAPSRTITERANELQRVLHEANVPGPFLLVAHSYGGAIVRSWARRADGDVAGLVLVDTPDEVNLFGPSYAHIVERGRWILSLAAFAMRCGIFRAASYFASSDDDVGAHLSSSARHNWPMAFTPEAFDAAHDDLTSIITASPIERQPIASGALGQIPVIVVMHGIPFPDAFATLESGFRESQLRLAALSTRGELVVAERSNHNINMDEPQVVVDAIRKAYVQARTGR